MNQPLINLAKQRVKLALIINALLAITVLSGCEVAAPSSNPTDQPVEAITPSIAQTATPAPPESAIQLNTIGNSSIQVVPPVHNQLLIVARADTGDSVYTIGLLNPVSQQFVPITRVESYHPIEIEWKPDGTQFIYNTRGIGDRAAATWVFSADGTELFHNGMEASWIDNGRYLSVWTCQAPRMSPGNVFTVYDSVSWEEVCQRCDGGVGAVMDCSGRCTPEEECPSRSEAESQPQAQLPGRYQATIENYWLQITDSDTGVEQVYVLPNHHIVAIAWSPK